MMLHYNSQLPSCFTKWMGTVWKNTMSVNRLDRRVHCHLNTTVYASFSATYIRCHELTLAWYFSSQIHCTSNFKCFHILFWICSFQFQKSGLVHHPPYSILLVLDQVSSVLRLFLIGNQSIMLETNCLQVSESDRVCNYTQ